MPVRFLRPLLFLLSGFTLLLAAALPAADKPMSPKSVWLNDYEQALKVARADNKPILVVFRCEH